MEALIKLTDSARVKIQSLMEREKKSLDHALRVAVVGGGCSGFSYKLGFEDAPKETDKVFSENGIQVFMDPKSALFLKGLEIDFEDGLNGAGFVYRNPNADKSCGCGTSFAVSQA